MLHFRTSSGLVASTARGRFRDASGQSLAFGPTSGPGNFSFFSNSDVTAAANNVAEGSPITLGTRLFSTQPVYSLGIRWLAPTSTPETTLHACLFDDVSVGALIKDAVFTLPQLSEKNTSTGEWTSLYWHEVYWDEPVLIPASEAWTHSIVTTDYVVRSSFHDAPISRGSISATAMAGRFTSQPVVYPSSASNSSTYFVDGIFSLTP